MSEPEISLSFREGCNDLNIYDLSNEAIFSLRINKDFAVILCPVSDTMWLRAFGGDPEEQSTNKFGETRSMKKPQREVDQPLEMKTVNKYGHNVPLFKILVPKRSEIYPL